MKGERAIESLRRRIDVLNRSILQMLNRRVRAAQRIGAIKKEKGMRISDPARERAILAALVRHNPGPLDEKAVRAVFQAVIRQTKRLERESP